MSIMALLDTSYCGAILDGDGQRAAVHVATDPHTSVVTISVFTDDGHGNGNCILSIPQSALLRAVAGWNSGH